MVFIPIINHKMSFKRMQFSPQNISQNTGCALHSWSFNYQVFYQKLSHTPAHPLIHSHVHACTWEREEN